jgi:hypothetical protein
MNKHLMKEIGLWKEVDMPIVDLVQGIVSAIKVEEALPNMSQPQAAVTAIICVSGGYDVEAFKPNTLASLLPTGLIVVYKGIAFPIDVWE